MTKREAKRGAARLTAQLIEQYLCAGQPYADMGDVPDATRLANALRQIRDEMERRGEE